MATKKKTAVEAKPETIVSFKGFDAELKCRGFQYEIGATYTHSGKVSACESGFHACENPFDVWRYYPLLTDDAKQNRFAIVEQSGEIARHDEDSKIASASITITAELTLPDFIKRSVTWLIDRISKEAKEGTEVASGHSSKLAASGHSSKLAASGDSSKLAASGHSSKLAASGDYSQLAASGHSSKLAASGDYSKLAASGDYSKLAASGDSSQLAASGDYSQLAASGENSVIASSCCAGTAKGANGTWIALAEFNSDGKCVGFATGCIGQDGLQPDVWYRASGGELIAA